MTPDWTIALPTFNGAAHLAATLQSVMRQTDARFELIVCDDASTDTTLELVRNHCGNRAVIHPNTTGRPLGLAANWNRCMSLAHGQWLTILHQDDLLTPDFLAIHRQIAFLHPHLGLITGPAGMIDENGKQIHLAEVNEFQWPETDFICWPEHALSRVLVTQNPIRCPATSFRRDLGLKLGGFNSQWKYVVDWDFWHKLGQSAPVGLTGRTLAFQRWHSASETQKLAKGTIDLEENARIMRQILSSEPFTNAERSTIEISIQRRMTRAWWNRAWQAAKRGDRPLELKALKNAFQESPTHLLKLAIQQPRTVARLIFGGGKI